MGTLKFPLSFTASRFCSNLQRGTVLGSRGGFWRNASSRLPAVASIVVALNFRWLTWLLEMLVVFGFQSRQSELGKQDSDTIGTGNPVMTCCRVGDCEFRVLQLCSQRWRQIWSNIKDLVFMKASFHGTARWAFISSLVGLSAINSQVSCHSLFCLQAGPDRKFQVCGDKADHASFPVIALPKKIQLICSPWSSRTPLQMQSRMPAFPRLADDDEITGHVSLAMM